MMASVGNASHPHFTKHREKVQRMKGPGSGRRYFSPDSSFLSVWHLIFWFEFMELIPSLARMFLATKVLDSQKSNSFPINLGHVISFFQILLPYSKLHFWKANWPQCHRVIWPLSHRIMCKYHSKALKANQNLVTNHLPLPCIILASSWFTIPWSWVLWFTLLLGSLWNLPHGSKLLAQHSDFLPVDVAGGRECKTVFLNYVDLSLVPGLGPRCILKVRTLSSHTGVHIPVREKTSEINKVSDTLPVCERIA